MKPYTGLSFGFALMYIHFSHCVSPTDKDIPQTKIIAFIINI